MSLQDGLAALSLREAKAKINADPSLTVFGAARINEALDTANAIVPEEKSWTPWDVAKGAIGAGIGFRVGELAGKFLGMKPSTTDQLASYGMGLGTLINMDLVKKAADMNTKIAEADERDTRYAFRYGFLKKAKELGLLKTGAQILPLPTLPITPDTFAAPVRAVTGTFNRAVSGTGALLGHLDSASEADTQVLQMEAERQALEQQEAVLKAKRANRILGKLLAKRSEPATKSLAGI